MLLFRSRHIVSFVVENKLWLIVPRWDAHQTDWDGAESVAIDPEDTGVWHEDVTRRLVETREALGLDQQTFGLEAGLSQSRYNNYESGLPNRVVTIDAALLLCERYNVTLDWLYRGDPSGLPSRLWESIRSARKVPDNSKRIQDQFETLRPKLKTRRRSAHTSR